MADQIPFEDFCDGDPEQYVKDRFQALANDLLRAGADLRTIADAMVDCGMVFHEEHDPLRHYKWLKDAMLRLELDSTRYKLVPTHPLGF